MIPVAPTNLGPMCKPGPHDNPDAPHSCAAKNNPKTPCGCTPCPQTPGSDCSRCDNCQEPAFKPLAAHDGKVESFVILDDGHADSFAQSGLTDHFVETLLGDSASISKEEGLKEGLTKAKADACIRILLGQGSSASC